MPAPVVIENEGDGWWDGPDVVECVVCWDTPSTMAGTLSGGRYWLLRLQTPLRDAEQSADFEYLLVVDSDINLTGNTKFWDGAVPMYPVLHEVRPGEYVSFDGDLLSGVKAIIRRP